MTVLKLARDIYILEPRSAPPLFPYGICMYIEDERPVVIDLGAGAEAFAGIDRERVALGLMSHFHFDHTHGDSLFPNAGMLAGREEEGCYSSREEYLRHFGFDHWDRLMTGVRWIPFADATNRGLPPDVAARPGFRPIPLAGVFQNGDVIDLGRRRLKVLHLPGHTAGHYGFYFEEEGILFSGDIDMVPTGPWYFGESSDLDQFIASVRRVQEMDPRVLVVSHRRFITGGIREGLDRFVGVVLEREARLLESLDRPRTLEELAGLGIIFSRQRNMYQMFWERMGLRNHLKRLLGLGAVVEAEPGRYFRF